MKSNYNLNQYEIKIRKNKNIKWPKTTYAKNAGRKWSF